MPAFQILYLLILSVIWQILIILSKPFDSKIVNIISFCNEFAVSVYLYLAFLISDFLETQVPDNEPRIENLRLNFAWILTGILILTIFINLTYALVTIAISMQKYFKIKFNCLKESHKKYLD